MEGSGSAEVQGLLEEVQQRLAARADAQVKAGQDAYFKGVILHRGLKFPAVKAACKEVLKEALPEPAMLRELGLSLMRQPLQEDKIAGLIFWQHCLVKAGMAEQWRGELEAMRRLYIDGHVFAWSTCDCLCSRLLAPMIKLLLKGSPAEGQACSRQVLGWCRQENLWLRRSSVVAFVTMAKLTDDQVFPGFRSALLDTLAVTVQGTERFAQTGTGWVLRELGKGHADQMLQFVEANLPKFNREGLRYALEHQPPATRQQLMAQHKEQLSLQPAAPEQAASSRRTQRRQPEEQAEVEAAARKDLDGGAKRRRRRA